MMALSSYCFRYKFSSFLDLEFYGLEIIFVLYHFSFIHMQICAIQIINYYYQIDYFYFIYLEGLYNNG